MNDQNMPETEYDVSAIQQKWLPVWDELKPFDSGKAGDTRPTKYVLDMFPTPLATCTWGTPRLTRLAT